MGKPGYALEQRITLAVEVPAPGHAYDIPVPAVPAGLGIFRPGVVLGVEVRHKAPNTVQTDGLTHGLIPPSRTWHSMLLLDFGCSRPAPQATQAVCSQFGPAIAREHALQVH